MAAVVQTFPGCTVSRLPTSMCLICSPSVGLFESSSIASAEALAYTIPMNASWGTFSFFIRERAMTAAPTSVNPSENR